MIPSAVIRAPTAISSRWRFCTAASKPAGLAAETGGFAGTTVPSYFWCILIVLQVCFAVPSLFNTTRPAGSLTSVQICFVSAAIVDVAIRPNAIITSSFFIAAPYKGGSTCAAGPGRPAYAALGAGLLGVENVLDAGLPSPGDGLPNPVDGLLYPVDGLLYPPDGLPNPFDGLLLYPEFMP